MRIDSQQLRVPQPDRTPPHRIPPVAIWAEDEEQVRMSAAHGQSIAGPAIRQWPVESARRTGQRPGQLPSASGSQRCGRCRGGRHAGRRWGAIARGRSGRVSFSRGCASPEPSDATFIRPLADRSSCAVSACVVCSFRNPATRTNGKGDPVRAPVVVLCFTALLIPNDGFPRGAPWGRERTVRSWP
jgi:hypothetical protein